MEHGGQVGQHVGFFSDPETWVSIAFLIFFLLFGAKLWRALTATLDRRASMIGAELDEASRLRTEAEAFLSDAAQRRDAALAEAEQLLQTAQAEASRLTKDARLAAEAAAERRNHMVAERIKASERAALTDLRKIAADAAIEATKRMLQHGLSDQSSSVLIDTAINTIPSSFAARHPH